MFRAFNLSLSWQGGTDELQRIGAEAIAQNEGSVKAALAQFLSADGVVDGTGIQSRVFPQIAAEVFISHSHWDSTDALALAGWLKRDFNLTSFIDSYVWGYADDLLKGIDNVYCWHDDSRQSYSYERRNGSTSHVHMMLATALAKMIDSTECILFLNTPNAISAKQATDKTRSPWLFAEIALIQLLRQASKEFHRQRFNLIKTAGRSTVIGESRSDFRPEYVVDLSSLTSINNATLLTWRNKWKSKLPRGPHALDDLYSVADEAA